MFYFFQIFDSFFGNTVVSFQKQILYQVERYGMPFFSSKLCRPHDHLFESFNFTKKLLCLYVLFIDLHLHTFTVTEMPKKMLKPVLGVIGSVAHFITVNEQTHSN